MEALAHSVIAPITTGKADLDAAHLELRQMDGALRAAKAQGQPYSTLAMLAEMYVDASKAYQILRWGKVHQRITVAALLR